MEGSRKRATAGKVDGGKETGSKKSRTDQHKHCCQPSLAIIDRLIDDVEKECRDHVDAMKHGVNDVCKLSHDYIDRIMSVRTDISDKAKKDRDNNLFPLLKEAETLIAECKTLTSDIQHTCKCNVKPCLVGNTTLLEHLHSVGAIRQLVTENFPCLSDDINIGVPTDRGTCHVSGLLVLAGGRLLLSDGNNMNIKLFDDNHTLVSHVPLQLQPSDIAETAGGQVAVCMSRKNTIKFVSVSDTLTPGQVIQTEVPCWSITRCGDNLAVVHWESRDIVEIDMRGRKVTTVWTCPDGDLQYIRHNTGGELITTVRGHGVTRVTPHGVVQARYKGDNLAAPCGLTVHPDGSIYLCDRQSGNIHHITADFTRIKVFGDGRVSEPYRICYNQHDNSLYVSQGGGNDCINVFRL